MKVLRVNMTSLTTNYESLKQELSLLGNRGLIAEILNSEIPPTCEPLGKANKLVIAVGPLIGLGISSAGRISVGAKSPLTGGIKEANGGGIAGQKLGKHGIRAIIIEGINNSTNILIINKNGVRIEQADEYALLGNYSLAEQLLNKYGKTSGVISIGPAGEMKMAAAGVFINDMDGSQSRACARGGMGAVMGSKGLKAIVIEDDGEYKPTVANPDGFKQARKAFHDIVRSTPQTSEIYTNYGTSAAVMTMNQLGAFPTRNFREGSYEHAELISGDALYDLIEERKQSGSHSHACMNGCIIKCSNIVPKKDGSPQVSPLEFESIGLLGSNLGVSSLDDIAHMNYLCNDIGVDTIEIGAALGITVDAGLTKFEQPERFIELIKEVGAGTVFGRVLGQGAVITAKVLGIPRVPAVKGQAFAAHEPRGIKGMAVTYAMSPMGADHTAAITLRAPIDHSKPEGQMELSRNVQVLIAAYDTLGLCMFLVPAVGKQPQVIMDLLNTTYGTDFSGDWLTSYGKQVIKNERKFNLAAGLNEAHDRLPEFCMDEPLPPHNQVADIPIEDYKRFWESEFWGE